MDYKQAIKKSLTVEWVIGVCPQGEECWCRTIMPKEDINYLDGEVEDKFYIIGQGEMQKEIAEHFVKIHNEKLNEVLPMYQFGPGV